MQITKKEKTGTVLWEDFIKKLMIDIGTIGCLEIITTKNWSSSKKKDAVAWLGLNVTVHSLV